MKAARNRTSFRGKPSGTHDRKSPASGGPSHRVRKGIRLVVPMKCYDRPKRDQCQASGSNAKENETAEDRFGASRGGSSCARTDDQQRRDGEGRPYVSGAFLYHIFVIIMTCVVSWYSVPFFSICRAIQRQPARRPPPHRDIDRTPRKSASGGIHGAGPEQDAHFQRRHNEGESTAPAGTARRKGCRRGSGRTTERDRDRVTPKTHVFCAPRD